MLRQDPDVILIGEMRDSESFSSALAAAETGHLFFSTLHTGNAAQSVLRILDFFPILEREQLRMSLAANLRAVVCQRLIPAIQGGVVPAVEIMMNTPTVQKLIEKNDPFEIGKNILSELVNFMKYSNRNRAIAEFICE